MDIKKIINCTPEQFEALHRDGQVEVDGVVRTREEGTLYNPGELPLLEWYNKVMAEELGRHTIAHTPMTTKTLEQEYEDILTNYENYTDRSAVGYRAILQNGDTVKVEGNSGDFFLNGERLTKDYTYNGNGCELVNVWVFEGMGIYGGNMILPPQLKDTPTFAIYEIYIKCIGQIPEVEQSYYLYANKITTYSFELPTQPRGCRVFITKGTTELTKVMPTMVQEVESYCEKVTTANGAWEGRYVERIKLPECREIVGVGIFKYLDAVTNWEFGKLIKVGGGNSTYCTFNSVNSLLIPNTVKVVNKYTVRMPKTGSLRIECNNANSIDTTWCLDTPANFSMAKDWRASINIAIAAKNWTKDRFIDLFTNYLADMNSSDPTIINLAELTIPQSIYDELTDEEFAIAEDKGWTIGGA